MAKEYPRCNFDEYRPSRNPYYQVLLDYEKNASPRPRALLDGSTERQRGAWRRFFGVDETTELVLELGAYHGETLNHIALQNPKSIHIGVEWKYKQSFVAARKAGAQNINNICFLRANMARLPWIFAPGEVDRVLMFFPDPWSKGKHQKNRTLNPDFLRTLGYLLKEGAEFFIKTDHNEYAAYIQESLAEAKCFDPLPEARGREMFASIPPTPFEKIFQRQGLPPANAFALVRNSQQVVPPLPVQDILGFARH